MRRFCLLIACLILQTAVFSQYNLNDYKYLIVEKQFHFQGEPNQYGLNQLVKSEFEKLGFNVLIQGEEYPEDLQANFCLALMSKVSAKGILRTKSKIVLKNCQDQVVYSSGEGVTREKNLNKAFAIAIDKAFNTMRGMKYSYSPGNESQDKTNTKPDIKVVAKKEKPLPVEKEKNNVDETAEKPKSENKELEAGKSKVFLMAEMQVDGMIIRESSGKKIKYQLVKSKLNDVYLSTKNEGIIYQKRNGDWVREYVSNGQLISEPLYLKFQ